MDAQRQAFLDAIAAEPYDKATRLVFADWLEEHGEDDEAALQRRASKPAWQKADKRMREFIDDFNKDVDVAHKIDYDNLLKAATAYLDSGKTISVPDLPERIFDEMPDFWRAYGSLMGRRVKDKYGQVFEDPDDENHEDCCGFEECCYE